MKAIEPAPISALTEIIASTSDAAFPSPRTIHAVWVVAALFVHLGITTAAEADDPAMLPTRAHRVSPGEYGPETRSFQGIPGLARAPHGRLWATWYGGGLDEGPENYLMLATSDDNGNTWSQVRFVVDAPGEVRVFDPVLWVDPQGRLWWFFAQSYKWWDGRGGVWAVVTGEPDQPELRWSEPRRIADGVMMQKPTVTSRGDWLLPIAGWNHEPPKDVPSDSPRYIPPEYLHWDPARAGTHVFSSTDRGAAFGLLGTAHVPNVRFEEHMIVERRNGSLWMLARTSAGISESVSTDGGSSWSEGRPASIPHVPSRFFIRRLNSGRLLLVKHNPRMDAGWLAGKETEILEQRSHLTAYLSDDDGQSWHGGLVLDSRLPVSYPDGDQAPDGTIYIVSDFDRQHAREILLARFTEEDVVAGKLVGRDSRLGVLVNKATGSDFLQD